MAITSPAKGGTSLLVTIPTRIGDQATYLSDPPVAPLTLSMKKPVRRS